VVALAKAVKHNGSDKKWLKMPLVISWLVVDKVVLKYVVENTSVFTPNRDTCSHLVEVKEVVAFATAIKHNGLNNKWLKMPPGISWLRGSQTHR
jgi:hypothetical protein